MLLHSNRTGRIDSDRPGESSAACLALIRPVNEGIHPLGVPVDVRLTGIYRSPELIEPASTTPNQVDEDTD